MQRGGAAMPAARRQQWLPAAQPIDRALNCANPAWH
jgi:hypothetical protein